VVLFGIADGGPAHQYRAGVKAEHRIVPARQAVQRMGGVPRPADIVQKNVDRGVAPARNLFAAVQAGTVPFFFKRAGGAVTGEPFAFWVIGQPAKHIHRNAILQKTFHNIIDAEIFRPEMLRNNKNLFLRGQRAHTFRKLGVRK